MPFVKNAPAHRALLAAVYNNDDFDAADWLELHLNRNEYNVRNIGSLRHTRGSDYVDETGRTWTEVSTIKNKFHMPAGNYWASIAPFSTVEPYSRKFLSPDNTSGLGGEFEMIIRTSDNKRIDALTHETYQETYNFGRTSSFFRHKKLDVDPHGPAPQYAFKRDMGYTTIVDPVSFVDELKDEFSRGINRLGRTGRL